MQTIAISKFKARCLAILEEVRRTGEPVRVTRFGKPVAEVIPPTPGAEAGTWLGCRRDDGRIVGDIVSSPVPTDKWDALSREPDDA